MVVWNGEGNKKEQPYRAAPFLIWGSSLWEMGDMPDQV